MIRQLPIENLEVDIDILKSFISQFNEYSVLGWTANTLHHSLNLIKDTGLSSPYKQMLYLCSLCLSTRKVEQADFGESHFEEAKRLLQRIVKYYLRMFFLPPGVKKADVDAKWFSDREISMPAFLDYFNVCELAYPDQIIERINSWFSPFKDYLRTRLGFSAEVALVLYQEIFTSLREKIHRLNDLKDQAEDIRDQIVSNVEDDFTPSRLKREARKLGFRAVFSQLMEVVGILYSIDPVDLCEIATQEEVNAFLRCFCSERIERDFRYYTENNFLEVAPLYRITNGRIFVPFYKQLLGAIYEKLYKTMLESPLSQRFLRHRDQQLEQSVESTIRTLSQGKGTVLCSLCETPTGQFEHDILWIVERNVVVVECKATRRKEPFRDPDKAAERIRQHFHGEKGIQKAYQQGLHFKQFVTAQSIAKMYDRKGKLIIELRKEDLDNIFIVVVTADSFGPLAVDLSILLKKPEGEPYPWCCNFYELQLIVYAFLDKGMQPDQFITYLQERSLHHEKFICSDELELCGFFIQYGSFSDHFPPNADKFTFSYDMSDIFDEIYFRKHGEEFPLDWDPEPYVTRLSREMIDPLG